MYCFLVGAYGTRCSSAWHTGHERLVISITAQQDYYIEHLKSVEGLALSICVHWAGSMCYGYRVQGLEPMTNIKYWVRFYNCGSALSACGAVGDVVPENTKEASIHERRWWWGIVRPPMFKMGKNSLKYLYQITKTILMPLVMHMNESRRFPLSLSTA